MPRLLDSLFVNEQGTKIVLTDKGRSSLMSILTCRNIMYQEVYWHKTVRACNAMFKRFFYEFSSRLHAAQADLENLLSMTDDGFVKSLYHDAGGSNDGLGDLIAPFVPLARELYKPAYVFHASNADREPRGTRSFFEALLSKSSYADSLVLVHKLADVLKTELPSIRPTDVLLETTPVRVEHERSVLQGFALWSPRKGRYDSLPLETSNLNMYLVNNRQAYIFCHPRLYDAFRKISPERLGMVLGKVV